MIGLGNCMVVQRLLMNCVGGGDDGWEGVLNLFISHTLYAIHSVVRWKRGAYMLMKTSWMK
jgi:hypothetical protein